MIHFRIFFLQVYGKEAPVNFKLPPEEKQYWPCIKQPYSAKVASKAKRNAGVIRYLLDLQLGGLSVAITAAVLHMPTENRNLSHPASLRMGWQTFSTGSSTALILFLIPGLMQPLTLFGILERCDV